MNEGNLSVRLSASMTYGKVSHVAECPDIGPDCFTDNPPEPFNHHVSLFMSDINLLLAYGITSYLAVETRFTLGITKMDAEFDNLDGTPRDNPQDEIHHRDETLVGLRDPWLVFRLGGVKGGLSASARLGMSFPVGRTEPDPYAAGALGIPHQHLQFGTGTFMPIVGGAVAYAFDFPLELGATGIGLFNLYENSEGYRAPSRLYGIFRVTVPLDDDKWRPYVDLTYVQESEELWHGHMGMEGITARRELHVGAGVAWRFLPGWQADLGLRARVAGFTDAAAFNSPGVLEVGATADFDLLGNDEGLARETR
ncbi:MAG TPA: transporter [Polyangiaceae bacterium]|nr:transporter [Polyangiaceae bacterium]